MTLTDFGPVKPSIQPYQNGYSVPVGLQQVERSGIEDGTVEHSWQGYLLIVPFLSELELDTAIAKLPAGDYSADKTAALTYRVQQERRAAYPPTEELLYAIAEEDNDSIATYKAKCAEVKKRHPLYWDPGITYKAGDRVQHQGVIYSKLDDGDNSAPDDVAGGWAAA